MESTVVPDVLAEKPDCAEVLATDGGSRSTELGQLADAFERFTQKAAKLRDSYVKLKRHVRAVNRELEEKNAELRHKIGELDATRTYLHNVLESMGSGVIAVSTDGRITMMNTAAEHMTGYGREELIGRHYGEAFAERDDGVPAILLALETGVPHVFKERALSRRDGTAIPVGVSSSPLRDANGAVCGAIEIFHDLRELKRLEERVRCADRLAALGQMAAAVAHEIRNPLGGIEGFAALLERDLVDEPAKREMARQVVQGARSLNRIVARLLDFTRPMTLTLRRAHLSEIAEAALAVVEREMEGGNGPSVRVVRRYAKADTAIVDREQMYGVVLNLVRNAWQAMRGPGEIVVRVDSDGTRVMLSVGDTGCGMTEEVRQKLFSPFFTTKETGTGLGLSIVRKVVLAHGGSIEVESEPGVGSLFAVSLPRPRRAGRSMTGMRQHHAALRDTERCRHGDTERPRC
jgi:PAS domain S-box-containing protein